MEAKEVSLDIERIKNGWAAHGDGWSVHGETKEEAVERYYEAIRKHEEIAARPIRLARENKASG